MRFCNGSLSYPHLIHYLKLQYLQYNCCSLSSDCDNGALQVYWFVWQGVVVERTAGVVSVGSCKKPPSCPIEPMPG